MDVEFESLAKKVLEQLSEEERETLLHAHKELDRSVSMHSGALQTKLIQHRLISHHDDKGWGLTPLGQEVLHLIRVG